MNARDLKFNGMVARFLPSCRIKMLSVNGDSLEEHSDHIIPFLEGECFRGEHLAELTIEKHHHAQAETEGML